jgi:hypothetical protein
VPPALPDTPAPSDKPIYIERKGADDVVLDVLRSPGATITIKGHRHSGKTMVLARLHAWAAEQGRACCFLDFQGIDTATLQDTTALFREIARSAAYELDLAVEPEEVWSGSMGPGPNLTRFMERQVLDAVQQPVLLLFDEVDRTFPYPAAREDLFATLRSWHSKRAFDRGGKRWKRFGMVIAHATDPALWIKDLNQSPFNVADKQVELDDFDRAEVAAYNERYGGPLSPEEVDALMRLVGGHPYLVSLALHAVAKGGARLADLERTAAGDEGPFVSHLHYLRDQFLKGATLRSAFRTILKKQACQNERLFQKLWSAGLVQGKAGGVVMFRCKIYHEYFRTQLP